MATVTMRYPNKALLREKQYSGLLAIQRLIERDVEILEISFVGKRPLFLVSHCPGVAYFNSECCGQGVDERGRFLKRRTRLAGCDVEWHTAVEP